MNPFQKQDADAAQIRDLLASGWEPGPNQLASAPVIDTYQFYERRGGAFMIGFVTDPSRGFVKRLRQTSPIVAMDLDRGWVRTLNTWYRLGEKMPKNYKYEPPTP